MIRDWATHKQLILALLISSLVGTGLLIYCSIDIHSLAYSYLLWNLFLAWIPLLLAVRLTYVLKHKRWSSWEGIGWSCAWIVFLPNSFYMISDFIHLKTVPSGDIVYFAASFTSIIYTAVVLGFVSLYMVHSELRKRLDSRAIEIAILLILAACSGAIYIGRDLRLNSWDILTNPGALIFDTYSRLLHISDYPTIIATGGVFFILLSSMYFLIWSVIGVIRNRYNKDHARETFDSHN